MIVRLIKRNDLLMTLSILRSFYGMPIALTQIITHLQNRFLVKVIENVLHLLCINN